MWHKVGSSKTCSRVSSFQWRKLLDRNQVSFKFLFLLQMLLWQTTICCSISFAKLWRRIELLKGENAPPPSLSWKKKTLGDPPHLLLLSALASSPIQKCTWISWHTSRAFMRDHSVNWLNSALLQRILILLGWCFPLGVMPVQKSSCKPIGLQQESLARLQTALQAGSSTGFLLAWLSHDKFTSREEGTCEL